MRLLALLGLERGQPTIKDLPANERRGVFYILGALVVCVLIVAIVIATIS